MDKSVPSVFCPVLGGHNDVGMYIGITVAVCIVLGAILIGLGIFFMKRKKSHPHLTG